MVKDLNYYTFKDALDRERILAKLGPELTADLYVNSSWHDRPPTVERQGLDQVIKHNDQDDNDDEDDDSGTDRSGTGVTPRPDVPAWPRPEMFFDERPLVLGSNNWVVSGAHTVSGKPLLSNDMHLGHREPGVWYEVQLHSGDFNVEGFSLPGLPFISVGHNQRIAWGFTNLNPDVQDLFIENFNAAGEYQTPTGWQKPEIDHQVIHVKGKPDVGFDVT